MTRTSISDTKQAVMVCAQSQQRIGLWLEDYWGFIVGKEEAFGPATPTDVLISEQTLFLISSL